MMRKIFPALVAVIAVTATGCTHDDDQSGVPACLLYTSDAADEL